MVSLGRSAAIHIPTLIKFPMRRVLLGYRLILRLNPFRVLKKAGATDELRTLTNIRMVFLNRSAAIDIPTFIKFQMRRVFFGYLLLLKLNPFRVLKKMLTLQTIRHVGTNLNEYTKYE